MVVDLSGHELGELGGDQFFKVEVTPGRHILGATFGVGAAASTNLELGAGTLTIAVLRAAMRDNQLAVEVDVFEDGHAARQQIALAELAIANPTALVALQARLATAAMRVDHNLSPAERAPGRVERIAVPKLSGAGSDAATLDVLSTLCAGAAARVPGLTIVSAAEVNAMLDVERQKDLLGCTDVSCIAEIGGALGVDSILSGQVGKLGEAYVVTMALIDIKEARTLVRGEATSALDAAELQETLEQLVAATLEPFARP
jgi:hypothetical protein